MKKNLTLFVVLVFVLSNNSYSQWTRLNSGTSANLFWLSFPANDTGYVISDLGVLYKTTNDGQTWQYVNSTPNTAMNFATIDTGLGCSSKDIYKTTNGGVTWNSVYHDTTLYLGGLFLLDHKNFFVFGFAGSPDSTILLKTTDGGNSWTALRFRTCGMAIGISFLTQNIGYLAGDGCVIKTIDGGLTWNLSYHDSIQGFNGIYFFSVDTGFALGTAGDIFRTDDGGQTWNIANTFGNNTLWYNMTFVNQNIGYIVGGDGFSTGSILKTTDGGFNWTLDTSFSETFFDVAFTKNLQVFASGMGGIILKTDVRPQPDICFVSVDSTTSKNMIIWEKDHAHLPLKYKIYKETTVAGIYNLLDSVAGNAFSTYLDTTSHPTVKADRYKLSFVDSLGVESAPSTFHKTIHLTVNHGAGNSWNLIWDQYEGFAFPTYYILRGNYAGNLVVIDSVQSNLTSYTDLNPPANEIYYAIGIIKPGGCSPSFMRPKQATDYILSSIGSSISNIVNRLTIGVDEIENNNGTIHVSPNPTTGLINILFDKKVKGGEINIFNVIGEQIYSHSWGTEQNEATLHLNALAGVYFLKISDDERQWFEKVIVE